MDEHTFNTKIISGHRITIREDIFEDLGLKEGEKIQVTVRNIRKRMLERSVVTE
jgi:uncharacterized protein Veg